MVEIIYLHQNINKLVAQLSRKIHFFTKSPKHLLWLVIFIIYSALCGCQRDSSEALSRPRISSLDVQTYRKPAFYASTWILAYMTQSLLDKEGDKVQKAHVHIITPPGQDPSGYVPDTQTLLALQNARLIILNGAQFERGLKTVSLPLNRVLKSASVFQDQWLTYPQDFSRSQHQHGPNGEHDHQGVDGHTWLDPHLLKQQLTQIKTRIHQMKLSTSAASYTRLIRDIDRLDQLWIKLSILLRQRELISNHPAYQYIARRYQLKITPFDLSPDEPPLASQIDKIRQQLDLRPRQPKTSEPPKLAVMLWEASPSPDVRQALMPLPLIHVVLHTLEQPPDNIRNTNHFDANPLQLYIDQLGQLASILEIPREPQPSHP